MTVTSRDGKEQGVWLTCLSCGSDVVLLKKKGNILRVKARCKCGHFNCWDSSNTSLLTSAILPLEWNPSNDNPRTISRTQPDQPHLLVSSASDSSEVSAGDIGGKRSNALSQHTHVQASEYDSSPINLPAHLLEFFQAVHSDQFRQRLAQIEQQLAQTLPQAPWWKPRQLNDQGLPANSQEGPDKVERDF
jgi:hypothetical protein